jgi:FixJ family two-component response regulator
MREGSAVSPIVFVVDDDASVRESLKDLLESVGLHVEVFESADAFLANRQPDVASCLVLDVRLPGRSGLEFQAELTKAGISLPIIFITGHGDIPMSVRAMKSGAIEFLTKPFRDQDLLEAVRAAIDRDRARREQESSIATLKTRFASLTGREKEVIGYVSAGFLNKQIAAEMGISEVTVKVHRRNIMQKMNARSLAELVRMADLLSVGRAVSKAH